MVCIAQAYHNPTLVHSGYFNNTRSAGQSAASNIISTSSPPPSKANDSFQPGQGACIGGIMSP